MGWDVAGTVLEKERSLALPTRTGLNSSGVVRAGLYYVPGSLKAWLVAEA
jgi:L-2-hydroxyglutarate oxidase LhgO